MEMTSAYSVILYERFPTKPRIETEEEVNSDTAYVTLLRHTERAQIHFFFLLHVKCICNIHILSAIKIVLIFSIFFNNSIRVHLICKAVTYLVATRDVTTTSPTGEV